MRGRERRRLYGIAATVVGAAGAAWALSAGGGPDTARAQYPEPPEVERPNPCLGTAAATLLCPDLLMAPPSEMFVSRKGGRLLLHATNDIRSRGEGPLEVRGARNGKRTMSVRQAIHNTAGKRKLFETDGRLVFYDIPGQGPYWKYHEAARFELWSLGSAGARESLVRTGPKLDYCFRDLEHTQPSKRSPRKAVYPGCSQNPRKRGRTLGTSVGWSDVYPSDYYQNWVSVKGLSGCFEFVHRADPDNYIFENVETNNEGSRRVRLPPPRRGKIRGC
jgi:hypothetical protein